MKRLAVCVAMGAMLLPGTLRAGSWFDKVKLSGDFRHRHELTQAGEKDDRHRWRIRARLVVSADVTDDWSMNVRLATGSTDPVSTNQTLDGGFSTKGFMLDQAYFDFHPGAVKGLHVRGGKMKFPFMKVEKTELIWDGDLSPEGAALMYKTDVTGQVGIFLNSAFFYIDERSSGDDTWMAGVQGGFKVKPADDMHLVLGGGYYDYREIEEVKALFKDDGEPDWFGNSPKQVIAAGDTFMGYAWDYNLFEAFGEFGIKLEKVSLKFYGNFVTNTGADSLNTGYLIGTAIKYGKDKGHVNLRVNYRELEDDAVFAAFTDSDFIGGGTDGNGFEFGFGYGIARKVDLGLTYFLNKKGIDDEVDYKRLQADLKLKF